MKKNSRHLSWSSISQWEYDKEAWARKYIDGIKEEPSKEMIVGKEIGERLASDPAYLPQVPRLPVFEQELSAKFGNIPLIGYIDSYCPRTCRVKEYKTGKRAWDKKRADKHGQISMYLLMLFLQFQVKPENVDCELVWLSTEERGDFSIALIEPVVPQIFKTKRTMTDILKFGMKIKSVHKEMQEFIHSRACNKVSPQVY